MIVGGDCFGEVVGEVYVVVGDYWNVVFGGFGCVVVDCCELWYFGVSDDMCCVDVVGFDVDFDVVDVLVDEGMGVFGCSDVVGD